MRVGGIVPAYEIPSQYGNNIGLYRDDGLGAFKDSPRIMGKVKKLICKIFSEHQLKITIEPNKKCVNFLDITFDLRTETYKPYNKARQYSSVYPR